MNPVFTEYYQKVNLVFTPLIRYAKVNKITWRGVGGTLHKMLTTECLKGCGQQMKFNASPCENQVVSSLGDVS